MNNAKRYWDIREKYEAIDTRYRHSDKNKKENISTVIPSGMSGKNRESLQRKCKNDALGNRNEKMID